VPHLNTYLPCYLGTGSKGHSEAVLKPSLIIYKVYSKPLLCFIYHRGALPPPQVAVKFISVCTGQAFYCLTRRQALSPLLLKFRPK
jgi:hypothetical protein